MAVIVLPVPGENPNWGSKLNAAILFINSQLEDLGVKVSQIDSDLSSVTLRVTNLEGRVIQLEDNLEDEVRRIAADVIASDPTIIEAAENAVEEAVADLDLVLKGDPEVFVVRNVAGWQIVVYSVIDNDAYVVWGIRDSGQVFTREDASSVRSTFPTRHADIPDCTTEWWNSTSTVKIGFITYGCGVSSTGQIIAWKRRDRNTVIEAQVVGTIEPGTPADDHNAPSYNLTAGGRHVITWQDHGNSSKHHVAVGDTRGENWLPQVDLIQPGATSYQQVYRVSHLTTAEVSTFWILYRSGVHTWVLRDFTVDEDSGAVSQPTMTGRVISAEAADLQIYCISKPVTVGSDQGVDLFAYPNPEMPSHSVKALRVNFVTGAVTDRVSGSVIGNISDSTYPAIWGSVSDFLPDNGPGNSRRIFYPHPTDDMRLLIAEGSASDPSTWVYKDVQRAGGVTSVIREYGTAGVGFGFPRHPSYIGGASYSPNGGRVATCHKLSNGGSVLRVWTGGTYQEIDWHSHHFTRPWWVTNSQILVNLVERYNSYLDYLVHQRMYDL